jgi:histidinol-phosphatase (PHP family)
MLILNMIYNFHTHSDFSDGKNSIIEIVQYAATKGVNIVGFSDHSPVPFESDWNMPQNQINEYLKTINQCAADFPQLTLFSGIEADFIPGFQDFSSFSDFDYIIGSVHYALTDNFPEGFDSSPKGMKDLIDKYYQNDIKKFITYYYNSICQMCSECEFDIVGHLDLVKKFNTVAPMFDETEKWYYNLIMETLTIIKEKNLIIEINTGGISRNLMKEPYPSFKYLKEANMLNIPVTISSDAHTAENLIAHRGTGLKAAAEAGYKAEYIPGIKKFQPIT